MHNDSLGLCFFKSVMCMNSIHIVHNLIILDESGSMHSIKILTIQGFNEIAQTIKSVVAQFPRQAHFISQVSFNCLGQKTLLWKEPVSRLHQLDIANYWPSASTPLFDAIGYSTTRLDCELQGVELYNVLVTIFTDRAEKASVEFSGLAIKLLIEGLKAKNWTFTYIGTYHEVEELAVSISINNVMKFEKTESGIKNLILKDANARRSYSQKIRAGQDTKKDFYSKDNT